MSKEIIGNAPEGSPQRPTHATIAITRNHVFAFVFVCFSIAAGSYAFLTLEMGTPSRMGPGFFPVVLSVILGILALLVGIVKPAEEPEPLVVVPLRRFAPVILAPVLFGLAIGPLGLVPTMFITVFEVSFASRFARLKESFLLAAGFTAFCVLVFHYMLGLPIPLWGSLLGV